MEGPLVESATSRLVPVDGIAVMFDQVFRGGDQEARGAAGRVADHILRRRRSHFHHQLDDMARSAELAVLPGSRDLAQHVLVEIALGIGIGHVDAVELVHHVGQHPGDGYHEQGVPHVMGVGRILRIAVATVAPEGVPNALLARYFQGQELLAHLDFSAMKETKPDALFTAWLALPEAERKAMEFQDIFELSCEKGFRAIIDEARWQMQSEPDKLTDFIETLSALPNHYHRAMVTYLDHRECWRGATRFYHADTLPYWRKRKNCLPADVGRPPNW